MAVGFVAFAIPQRKKTIEQRQRADELQSDVTNERQQREATAIAEAAARATADRVPTLELQVSNLQTEKVEANKSAAELNAKLDAERKTQAARIEELEKVGEELKKNFAILASEALGKNNESFLALMSERFEKHKADADKSLEERQKAIEVLVKPIEENLSKFEKTVGELEKTREGAYRAITEQVKGLAESQIGLKSETNRLVQALRRPQTRGRWGEYQLRNVLEMAGMHEHVDFVEQQTISGDEGNLRPDVIVNLPGGKSIVVDAKTPLDAYLSAIEATEETDKEDLLRQHARQVREHVRKLSSQSYWKRLAVTPDFVVMFVPGEAFFAAAIESDPGLFEQAVSQKVLISTPTTFIALIKAIAYGWQQEKLTENAQAVGAMASELFDRIKVFGGHLADMGKSLRQTVERYNKGVSSLEGRVLPTARKFENLGVVPQGSSIPEVEPIDLEARDLKATELIAKNATRETEN